MKNLKKVLALVLVVALFASFAVSASATSFRDDSDIKYVDAVNFLTAANIIEGYTSDNTFRPNNTVTRAEMAKMLYVITTGYDDKAVSFKGSGKFPDTKGTWYDGYVNWAAAAGIVEGYNSGLFKGDKKISGYETLTMILRAVGYGQVGEYSKNSWKVNVAADAYRLGIDNTVRADLNKDCARQEAAEYLYRALGLELKVYNKNTASYDSILDTLTTGTLTYKLFGDQIFTAALTVRDAFGRPTSVYTAGKLVDNMYTGDEAGRATITRTPVKTYTTAVTGAQIFTDLGLSNTSVYPNGIGLTEFFVDGRQAVLTNNTVNGSGYIYYDGATTTPSTQTGVFSTYTGFAVAPSNRNVVGGNGSVVEVYYYTWRGVTHLEVIEINTYVGTIRTVNDASVQNGITERSAYITLNPETPTHVTNDPAYAGLYDNGYFLTTAYTTADRGTTVLYTAAYDRGDNNSLYNTIYTDSDTKYVVQSVEKAATVAGPITKVVSNGSASVITLGDTEYKLTDKDVVNVNSLNLTSQTVTFYVDAYGYLAKLSSRNFTARDSWMLILSYTAPKTSAELNQPTVGSANVKYVTIYGIDGNGVPQTVTLAYHTGDPTTWTATNTSAADNSLVKGVARFDNVGGVYVNLVNYTLRAERAGTTHQLINGKTSTIVPYGTAPQSFTIDEDTLFVFYQFTDYNHQVMNLYTVTGRSNVGDFWADKVANYLDVNYDGIADVVYINDNYNPSVENANYAYLIANDTTGKNVVPVASGSEMTALGTKYTYVYKAIVPGIGVTNIVYKSYIRPWDTGEFPKLVPGDVLVIDQNFEIVDSTCEPEEAIKGKVLRWNGSNDGTYLNSITIWDGSDANTIRTYTGNEMIGVGYTGLATTVAFGQDVELFTTGTGSMVLKAVFVLN